MAFWNPESCGGTLKGEIDDRVGFGRKRKGEERRGEEREREATTRLAHAWGDTTVPQRY
jgi:hypothetical protein